MRGRTSGLLALGVVLFGAIQPAFAVRFEAVRVDELTGVGTHTVKEIRAINNLGDIIGVSGPGQAVLLRQGSNGKYTNVQSDHYFDLPPPKGITAKSSVAVDFTNAKVTTKGAITIVGNYVDQNDLRHAIYWEQESAEFGKPYIGYELNPWQPLPDATGTADREARAVAISNNGVIVGTSYDAEGRARPVVWAKETRQFRDGGGTKDVTDYFATDLRTAETVTAGIAGEAIGIEKNGQDIVGLLKRPDSPFFDSVVWNQIEKANGKFQITLPTPLPAGQDDVSSTDYVAPKQPFERGATATSFGSTVGGWYEVLDSATGLPVPKPIAWFDVPKVYEDKKIHAAVYRAFSLETLNGIDGKILAVSSPTGGSGDYAGESGGRGMIITTGCGSQDVNQLLAKPLAAGVTIERLTGIAQGVYPAMMAGESGTGASRVGYLLLPKSVFVDVAASIQADHDRIEVGQRHTYTATVTNTGKTPPDGSAPTRATCITVQIEAAIYVAANLRQKRGGMTFLSATSDKAQCTLSEVAVTCTAPNLEPGESLDIRIDSEARPLLADRMVRTSIVVYPSETDADQNVTPSPEEPEPDFNTDNSNNTASVLVAVDRESCFIATAAYGSYLDPHVAALREFRDTYLKSNWAGRQLVSGYYAVSPSMAEFLLDHPEIKPWVRAALTPVVVTVEHPAETLFAVAVCGMLFWRFRAKRRVESDS